MSRILSALLFLTFSLNSFAELASVTVTKKSKKDPEQVRISCVTESCEELEFTRIKNEQETFLVRMTQEEYAKRMKSLQDRQKVRLKDHYFLLTQLIAKLPWDNSEFVIFYLGLGLITIPLTLAAVGIDAVVLPISTASLITDVADGNAAKKIKRKMAQQRDFRLNKYHYESFYSYLYQ
jgi:predicted dienelactone hydrolase